MRNNTAVLITFAVIVFAMSNSCVNDPIITDPVEPEMPEDTSMAIPSASCDPDTVYFVNDVLPILLSSCGMGFCHDANSRSAGVQITSYQTLIDSDIMVPFDPENSRMYTSMTEDRLSELMPPSPRGPISDTNILVVRRWIEQGGLNNACPDDTICDFDVPASFASQVFPTLDKYCIGCHSGNNPWGGIFLRTYDEIKVTADNGSLVGSISHAEGFEAMPDNSDKIPECLIEEIESWVQAGAPNN